MELSTYASGYPRLYRSDEEELAACLRENAAIRGGGVATIDPNNPHLHWWPSSVDFAAEAARHSPAVGVRDFRALLDEIQRRKSLSKVYWYGHGAAGELQFGSGQKLTIGEIASIPRADVSASLLPGAEVVFVACNAGQSGVFLQRLANALRVPVRGFSKGVLWRLDYVGLAPHRKISRRGLDDPKTITQGELFRPQS